MSLLTSDKNKPYVWQRLLFITHLSLFVFAGVVKAMCTSHFTRNTQAAFCQGDRQDRNRQRKGRCEYKKCINSPASYLLRLMFAMRLDMF